MMKIMVIVAIIIYNDVDNEDRNVFKIFIDHNIIIFIICSKFVFVIFITDTITFHINDKDYSIEYPQYLDYFMC